MFLPDDSGRLISMLSSLSVVGGRFGLSDGATHTDMTHTHRMRNNRALLLV